MILDSLENLNEIYSKLNMFINSSEQTMLLEAITKGSPEPYDEFLPYIEISKTNGLVVVGFTGKIGLKISGSKEYLAKYIEAFKFEKNENGNHHHPEFELINKDRFEESGLWPFIEADNEYVEENQYRS